jgi:glycosyltransferase involved in cell wall biosynthesis
MATTVDENGDCSLGGVIYIFQDKFPWDVRAEKFVESLAAAGHPTTILARNSGADPLDEQVDSGYRIHRLARGWGPISSAAINFPAFFSPFWIRAIIRCVKDMQAGLIIVRDLPLSPAAILAGKITGTPVLLDMAENYPAMIADTWRFRGRGRFDVLIRNPSLLRRLETWTVGRVDGIFVVSDESAERVRAIRALRTPPLWVVGNTPRLGERLQVRDSDIAAEMRSESSLKLLYVGGLEETRGLDVAIRSLAAIRQRLDHVSLHIVGDGTGVPLFREVASREGVTDSVYFHGWQDPHSIPGIVAAADICLVPHYVTEHTDTTLPNKIYDYMLAEKPVIVTHSKSLRNIVEKSSCGRWYSDKDPMQLAEAVIAIADPAVRAQMGSHGRRAVLERHNWSMDERVLLEAVSERSKSMKDPT